jgi:hypothetical protein
MNTTRYELDVTVFQTYRAAQQALSDWLRDHGDGWGYISQRYVRGAERCYYVHVRDNGLAFCL